MKFSRMLVISRPIFWLGPLGMFLVGMGNVHNFNELSLLELLFFTFPLNFYLYGLNDIYDGKSDRLNPRKGGVHGAVLTMAEVRWLKKYIFIPAILFLALAFLSKNTEHILLSLLFVVLSFAYSHSILRLKDIPILDTFTSAAIYCCPALIAFSLHSSVFNLSLAIFTLGIPLAGLHAITTLSDAKWDRKAGMNTTGVFLGQQKTMFFIILTLIIPLFFFWRVPLFLSEAILLVICCSALLFLKGWDYENTLHNVTTAFITLMVVDLLYFFLSANI